jgi:phage shock protein PspC (stress-responsive transcriptional regulator)
MKMSNLRERAREIRDAGAEERGNFQPSGTPLKMYQFWARHSNNVPARENFCHYWRVVAFWAPLMFLRVKGEDVLTSRVGLSLIAAFAIIALIVAALTTPAGPFILGLFIGVYILTGIFTGAIEGLEDEYQASTDVVRVFFWVSILVSGPVYGLCKLVEWIQGWSYEAKDTAKTVLTFLGVALAVLLVLGFFTLIILAYGWLAVLMVLGIAAAGVGSFLGLIIGISALADFVSGRRRVAYYRRLEAQDYDDEPREPVAPKEPGAFRKFMASIGDFIIFAAQVVRVKKWKICPIVTIDERESA